MHISYISPLSGWYLAQARPDLIAKDPTHTRLEQRKVIETSSSAWKADILTVVRPLHETQLTKHYCTITGEPGIIVAVKGDQQNGTQPFYDRGADSGHRTHTPKHQILNLACLPFHHTRINCASRGRTCDGGVKVLCLTAWRWRIIHPACCATLLCFQRAGNNVNEKFYMPFRAGLSDKI